MYDAPKLNVIGDAREVVLGYVDTGADLDAEEAEVAQHG